MSVVFYISGHGLGHASRDVEVINALASLAPHLAVHVRTAAPRWLFDRTLQRETTVSHVETDTGILQTDGITLDAAASLTHAERFHADIGARVAREADALRAAAATLVVGDVPALAFLAADAAGVPSVGLSNFTWDWIYAHYPEQPVLAPTLVDRIRGAHAKAELAYRLPMWGGFAGFRAVIDVPFVARHATVEPREVRRALGLPDDEPLVLLSFGGYGLAWRGASPLRSRHYRFVLTYRTAGERAAALAHADARTIALAEATLYGAGLKYPDLVGAVEVVASKPGYGIISECVANRTALLYTSRGDFAEYAVLVEEMPRLLRARYLSHDRLFGGDWDADLDALLRLPAPEASVPTNGARVVAQALAALARA